MRAALVSVDYADILAITLPYNRHHFDEVLVVTNNRDNETVEIAQQNNCKIFRTDTFYDNGAYFNKWKALELGLDYYGRYGWMCIMDADVLWPKKIELDLKIGYLYTPFRRMYPRIELIPEEKWLEYKKHRQEIEFAGYSQIFHTTDPHLGPTPWHQINWVHAGGADSFFQEKWPNSHKIRPSWAVLHLGATGTNWCGRASNYSNGSTPINSKEKMNRLKQIFRIRRATRSFKHEKFKE